MIAIKSNEDIAGMRIAGKLAAELLDYITPFVKIGVTTEELDQLCYHYMVDVQKTIPAPLNYAPRGGTPYPKSICTSINHQVCHGIPCEKKLKKGDILNIDVTVIKDGYHGDSSRMFLLGNDIQKDVSILARRLCDVTFESMWIGICQVKPGGHFGDIGAAIQQFVEKQGFSVVRDYCGHGIGKKFHEAPQVMHHGKFGSGAEFKPGMIFTIEPMINAGKYQTKQLADGWTAVTKDHSLSAQWEHTVLVTDSGFEILTISDGVKPCPDWIKEKYL